jgi:endonuclease III
MKYNFQKVFTVFTEKYKNIPLEAFSPDPYRVLISTLLSSRTKDETTFDAAQRLFDIAPDIYTLSKLDIVKIENIIHPVGFYKTKAKHLNKLAGKVIREFNGLIPKGRQKLMSLPGVGRKTANLTLNRAFGTSAIAVDTHVHKICNLLGWVKTNSPEVTEKMLIKILPKIYWKDINRLFVSIGRQYTTDKKLLEFLSKNNLLTVDC